MLWPGQLSSWLVVPSACGIHSTKDIILPVRPPILPRALYAEEPILDTVEPADDAAEPAELWTLVRPSEAFDTACFPLSWAFEAASEAVEACRKLFRRRRNLV